MARSTPVSFGDRFGRTPAFSKPFSADARTSWKRPTFLNLRGLKPKPPPTSFQGECSAPDGVVDSKGNTGTIGKFSRVKPTRALMSYEHTTVRCDNLS